MMSFLPQIGAHFNETKQMRFCEQLGLMLRAGVSMTDALERITKGDWSEWDRFRINTIRKGLIDGERLSQLIAECVFLEKESVKLLEIGEETGQTCARLEGISREMSIRIRWRIQQGIRLMEPCLVIVLAFLVGGMLAAFLIPLIDLYKYSL
jgi:type II secretory pathway component PulF